MSVYKQYGIYGIKNKINNKIYVGKTMNNFGDRWDCHKAQLRHGYNGNPNLQDEWNKYGEDNFDFIIIYNCKNNECLEDVNELEKFYIKKYKSLGLAYNIHDGGDEGLFLGKHLSEETKRKIGEKNRINMTGRKASDDTKRKMSESQKRRYSKWSDDDYKKWSEKISSREYKPSDETKAKISAVMKDNKHGAKYTVEQVKEIRKLYENDGKSYSEISDIMNIPCHTVYLIATYRRWKNIV